MSLRGKLALATVVLCGLAPGVASAQTVAFADWTSVSANVATGTVAGRTVTLSGSHVWLPPVSELGGQSSFFADPAVFTPALPLTDHIQVSGYPAYSYTLSFSAPVTDPILHVASLASTLEFAPGTRVARVSGTSEFVVTGTSVIGDVNNVAGGTIRIGGTVSSISFTATTLYAPTVEDGVVLQVGVPPSNAPVAARNVTPPSIEGVRRVTGGTVYRCDPGAWEGVPPGASFEYTWYRQGRITGTIGSLREIPTVQVAATQTFTLPEAEFGKLYYCVVAVRDATGQRRFAYSATALLTGRVKSVAVLAPRAYGNVQIRGIDVFQIVQPYAHAPAYGFPSGAFEDYCGGGTPTSWRFATTRFHVCGLGDRDPQHTSYAGVLLDQRKPTTAIVYVNMQSAAASDPDQRLDVTLSARVGGRALAGSITRRVSDRPVSNELWVTAAERADKRFGVPFAVPASWLAVAVLSGEPLDLEATVALPVGAGSGALQECPLRVVGGRNCSADNRFRLDGVPVSDSLPDLTVRSLPLLQAGQSAASFPSPERMLRDVRKLYPGGERLTILPYQGWVDIDFVEAIQMRHEPCEAYKDLRSCRQGAVDGALDVWWSRPENRTEFNILMGVHHYHIGPDASGNNPLEPGWKRKGAIIGTPGQRPTIALNDLTAGNPTTPAHEFGHALGLPHADKTCRGGSREAWPPDDSGRLEGVGFERTIGGGLGRAVDRYTLHSDPQDVNAADAYFDLMSYCRAGDGEDSWLSARNWNRAFDVMRAADAAGRRATGASLAAATAGRTGLALGAVGPRGARITRITPAVPGTVAPEADPRSPLIVRALDARGRLLSSVGADVEGLEDSPEAATFLAAVPAGAAVVELVSRDRVVDRVVRSRHAPRVRLIAPRRAERVGAHGRLPVRWRATDADGDELNATIDYAADGRTWRTVFEGQSRGHATIPGRFLEAGTRARLRVTVDDGFARAAAISGRFRADGTPPRPVITVPAAGTPLQAGRTVLIGSAVDDRGRRLRGRALTWSVGRRTLGRGERVRAALPAGRVTLKLRALDERGRATVTRRTLRITPVALQLTRLRVPDRVRPRASRMKVTIATSVAATLHAGGRSYRIGRRARHVLIPLPARPRTGIVRLNLKLAASGARQPRLRETVVVLRG